MEHVPPLHSMRFAPVGMTDSFSLRQAGPSRKVAANETSLRQTSISQEHRPKTKSQGPTAINQRLLSRVPRQGLDFAVFLAVGEVHNQPDREPDNQAGPVDPTQPVHHVAIKDDAENWYQRHPGRAEGTRLLGIRPTQHDHGERHLGWMSAKNFLGSKPSLAME